MKANILIIDDDPNKLDLLSLILTSLGQNIIKCNSGEAGLRVLLENEIAIILLDVRMPVLDGFETATIIRERSKTSTIPIIFITAFNSGEFNISKGYSLGAVDYIFFPFDEKFLLAKLKVFIDMYFLRKKEQLQAEQLAKINADLKRSNEMLERSNKDLEQFAYVASHDLQQPLRMVSMYSQLLANKYSNRLDETALSYIEHAVNGTKKMQILINDLLEYSRISSKSKKFIISDSSKLLKQAIENIQHLIDENEAEITYNNLPSIQCVESEVLRLFQNLISNAVKFRKISLNPKIHISCEQKNGSFIFSVKDNGIGIAAEYFEKIFIIFQRLEVAGKYPGTGIGLSICKRIVEGHNGKIWLESSENEGSTFYFSIPHHETNIHEKSLELS